MARATVSCTMSCVSAMSRAQDGKRIFTGAIASDTGHFTSSGGGCTSVAFGSTAFGEISTSPLQPADTGISASFFVRNLGKAQIGGSPIAGQFGLAWTAESADGRWLSYRLQFGDAFDDSIDYARTTCVTHVDGLCQEWQVTSLEGTAQTGEAAVRGTGPGSRGVQVLASALNVPYTIRIVRKE